jgi:hypothetical protein
VIQIFNVGAERMLGYTADEVTNQITPADISRIWVQSTVNGGSVFSFTLPIFRD